MGERRIPGWLSGVIGVGVLLAAWWLFALAFRPDTGTYTPVPSPGAVLGQLVEDGFSAYWGSFRVTITEAAWGFLWGNLAALLLAAVESAVSHRGARTRE